MYVWLPIKTFAKIFDYFRVYDGILRWHRRNANRACYPRFLLSRNSKNHQKRFCYAPLRTIFCRICVLRAILFSVRGRVPKQRRATLKNKNGKRGCIFSRYLITTVSTNAPSCNRTSSFTVLLSADTNVFSTCELKWVTFGVIMRIIFNILSYVIFLLIELK